MARYIDADRLLRNTIYNPNHVPYIAESDILFAPPANVVEVVRCKDCKHHEDEEPGMVYCPNQVGGWVSEGFFCGDGERRE